MKLALIAATFWVVWAICVIIGVFLTTKRK